MLKPKRLKELLRRAEPRLAGTGTEQDLQATEHLLDECDVHDEPLHRLLGRSRENTQRLLEVTRALNAEQQLERLLQQIVDAAIDLTGAERGFLLLGNEPPFEMGAARRFGAEDIDEQYFQFSHTVAAKVAGGDRVMRLEDALEDPELGQRGSVQRAKLRSILAVPLHGQEGVVGALYLDNRFVGGQFGEEHEDLVQAMGDQAAIAIENARLREQLAERTREVEQLNTALQQQLDTASGILANQRRQLAEREGGFHGIIGNSAPMLRVFGEVERIAVSEVPVVIQGESGTGKELVARAIHACSSRSGGPFISENTSAISEQVAESELFGHVKGAFTGADRDKKGLFELAQGGTLFLDEVAEMSSELQKKLLRVLQEGEVRPVGAQEAVPVDARIISAANKDLAQAVEQGSFREDLYYRLRGYALDLPPLRERQDDIPLLVQQFLDGRPITEDALGMLSGHDWRGNVRELQNACRALLAMTDAKIEVEHLPARIGGKTDEDALEFKPLDEYLAEVERDVLRRAMDHSRSQSDAAKLLSISRHTLIRRLKKYGMIEGDGSA